MSATTIDGNLIHFETYGRGKPVLFLHGWLGSWRYWMPAMEALSDKHRTYALDLWGYGDSAKMKGQYSICDYVTLVDNFINHLGLQRVTIVGHALGAIVMLAYMTRYPEKVDKLIAISLPLQPGYINRKLLGVTKNSFLAKMIQWPHLAHEAVQIEAEKTDRAAIKDSLRSIEQLNICRYLEKFGQTATPELLIVYGEKDNIVAPDPVIDLNGRWPNIRAIGLSESKHFPMLEEPSKFHRLLKDFLDFDDDLATLALKQEWRRRMR